MCIFKRIIFAHCGHAAWGAEIKVCNQQIAFQTSPATSTECDTMYSHPMHTIKVTQMCKSCEKKKCSTSQTAEKLKQALKDIRESVERMEKMQEKIETAKKTSADPDVEDIAALESWE